MINDLYDMSIFNPEPIPDSAYYNNTLWEYTLGRYDPVIQCLYRGKWENLPVSRSGSSMIVSSLVTEGRNAQGTLVGSQVGRDQIKFDGLVFPALYAHEWTRVLLMLKVGTPVHFRFYSPEIGGEIIRTLYPGDRTATIYAYHKNPLFSENTLRPEIFTDCSVNLIDRGEQ